jgi:peptide/nickel transport system ATP-binding protein
MLWELKPALRPKVLIADEPTSMVDACVRANILDYLMKLKVELGMTTSKEWFSR